MKKSKLGTQAFTLLEMIIAVLIIAVLIGAALPYYQNAVQTARSAEAVIRWGQLKHMYANRNMSRARADHLEAEANERNPLTYFTVRLVCRLKDDEELCWEAEFHLRQENQLVQYYLASEQNFSRLLCVPLNTAGEAFCHSQAAFKDDGPDAQVNGLPAYLIHY